MHAGSCPTTLWLRVSRLALSAVLTVAVAFPALGAIKEYKSGVVWPVPKVVDPGNAGKAPADAVVLFDGHDLSAWQDADKWVVKDGYAEACGGSITTKAAFGDCQLHVEWATPAEVSGQGQGRGNSGVYLMGKYEIQVLDSYENETYPDGQAGSVYKQHPPMVNVCRKPGEWQTYDILFTAPRFDKAGKLVTPAYVTLLHNGVVVQNHFELTGDTSYVRAPVYAPHPPKLPLSLQYHRNPVRFRNIWIRELKPMEPLKKVAGEEKPAAAPKKPAPKRKTTSKDEPAKTAPKEGAGQTGGTDKPADAGSKKAEVKKSDAKKAEVKKPDAKKPDAKKPEEKKTDEKKVDSKKDV